MKVCVVGNGPSAPRYAEAIDRCDCVVRVNAFPPDKAGKRWDVWASAFYQVINDFSRGCLQTIKAVPKVKELWLLGESPVLDGLPFRPDIKRQHMTAEKRAELERLLGARPTGGFMAVYMAYQLAPAELCLTGFDAVGGHYWTLNGIDWGGARCAEVHNLWREHSYYHDMRQGRGLFGFNPATKVEWWA